jgi:hypothetical protein
MDGAMNQDRVQTGDIACFRRQPERIDESVAACKVGGIPM